MMQRRSFLKGLIAAPALITTPGLLMPVKALPKPFAHVTGLLLDGKEFMYEIWDMRPASSVAAEPWFDNVARIDSYTYTETNPEKNPYVIKPEIYKYSRSVKGPMLAPHERPDSIYGVDRKTAFFKRLEPKVNRVYAISYEQHELDAFDAIDRLKEQS